MPLKWGVLAAVGAVIAVLAAACGDNGDSGNGRSSLESGSVVATEGGLAGGRIWFIWEGGKQRIQQPAGMEESDIAELGYVQGEPAGERFTLSDEEGSRWVVFPPTGPEARLWLVYDGVMHEVTPVPADIAEVEKLADIEDLVVTRVRLAED